MRRFMPSMTDDATRADVPTPYKLRDLIVRQTQALEAHTKADDEWRESVMRLFEKRLEEKDELIKLIKQSCVRDERDKARWYRVAVISLFAALLLAGVEVGSLVGLI